MSGQWGWKPRGTRKLSKRELEIQADIAAKRQIKPTARKAAGHAPVGLLIGGVVRRTQQPWPFADKAPVDPYDGLEHMGPRGYGSQLAGWIPRDRGTAPADIAQAAVGLYRSRPNRRIAGQSV
jgi:hypothetical protein